MGRRGKQRTFVSGGFVNTVPTGSGNEQVYNNPRGLAPQKLNKQSAQHQEVSVNPQQRSTEQKPDPPLVKSQQISPVKEVANIIQHQQESKKPDDTKMNENLPIAAVPMQANTGQVDANKASTAEASASEVPASEAMDSSATVTSGNISPFGRFFALKRKPSGVRAKEKKMRQAKRLRKVLIPKNALMALHEVRGIKIGEYIASGRPGGGFLSQITVNNIQYEGVGSSKNSAKNMACEKALRDLVIQKMLQKNDKKSASSVEIKTESPAVTSEGTVTVDNQQNQDEDVAMESDDADDDVPILNLASFALYKLFSEWENDGFEIPEFRQTAAQASNEQPEKVKNIPPVRTELPPSWEIMHPATLLCIMRPGVVYTELGGEGQPPNTKQRMGTVVDGQEFIGVGRSKKIARKNVAVDACNKLFGTNFVQEI